MCLMGQDRLISCHMTRSVSQLAEWLPSLLTATASIPSPTKTRCDGACLSVVRAWKWRLEDEWPVWDTRASGVLKGGGGGNKNYD